MTVPSSESRKTYAGNGSTTSFDTNPVVFFTDADLVVQVTVDATGATQTLAVNTDFTVSGGGTPPEVGTLDLSAGSAPYGAPAAGYTLVIYRDVSIKQETDFVQNDGSDADVQESSLDRLTMISQRLSERVDRAITLPDGDVSGASLELPALATRIGKFLAFDAGGSVSASAGTGTDSSLRTDLATGGTSTGAALVAVKAAGAGAVSRTGNAKAADILSAKDYGATGDGTTDDKAAVQLALNALPTGGGGVYFPTGTYKCTGALTIPNKAVALFGDGMGATVLKFTAATAGGALDADFTVDGTPFTVSDMTLQTSVAGGGKAIAASWPAATTSSALPSFVCRDVQLVGATPSGHYWNDGIVLTDCWNSNIIGLHSCGNATSDTIGTSASTSAIDLLGNSLDCIIAHAHIFHGTYGIRVRGTCEGVQIQNPTIVGQKYGVELNTAAGEPGQGIYGGHINTFTRGVKMTNRTDFVVSDVLIYKFPTSTDNYVGIETDAAAQGCRFTGNKIAGLGAAGTTTCISYAGDYATIQVNQFSDATIGVSLPAGATSNIVTGNQTKSVGTPVSNGGGAGANNICHTNGNPPTADGNTSDLIIGYLGALRSVDAAGTGTKPLVSWDQSTSSPVLKLAAGGANAVGYSMVMSCASLAATSAGNADLGGCIVWDTTNNRPIFFAPNGNRYYITPTGTV